MQELDPALTYHLLELNCPPLQLAFRWMVNGFVGHLDTEELLLLWDRVIGCVQHMGAQGAPRAVQGPLESTREHRRVVREHQRAPEST